METAAEERWPAVQRAYDFVIPSYQFLVARYEAADTRLSLLLTIGSTLTLGAPVVGRAVRPSIGFGEPLFLFAIVLFVVAAIVGLVGRVLGQLVLPHPTALYQTALHETPWEFQRSSIYFAGEHFTKNAKVIQRKHDIALFVTGALLVEVLVIVGWIAF